MAAAEAGSEVPVKQEDKAAAEAGSEVPIKQEDKAATAAEENGKATEEKAAPEPEVKQEEGVKEKVVPEETGETGDVLPAEQEEKIKDNASKIIRQVEFYFSDSNLPNDKFLQWKLGESSDGMVELGIVCSFSRMRPLLGLPTDGADKPEVGSAVVKAVAEVLKCASDLKISENGKRVGRALPLDDAAADLVNSRSLMVAPLPLTTTIDSIKEFFQKDHGVTVLSVRLRRHPISKDFRGSAFVEFETEEKALEVEKMTLVHEGATLRMEQKKAFIDREGVDVVIENSKPVGKRTRSQTTAEESEKKQKLDGEGGAKAEEEAKGKEEGEEAEPAHGGEADFTPGCLLAFEIESGDVGYLSIREALTVSGAVVKFVDYQRDAPGGTARFDSPESAQKAIKSAGDEKRLDVEGGVLKSIRIVEGEEETEFYKKLSERMKSRRAGGQGGQRGRGGRGGRRGRGRGRGR